jgi:hypothetical protein
VATAAVVGCLDVSKKFTMELAIIADMFLHLKIASVFTRKVQREKLDITLKTYTPIRQLFTSFRRTSLSLLCVPQHTRCPFLQLVYFQWKEMMRSLG